MVTASVAGQCRAQEKVYAQASGAVCVVVVLCSNQKHNTLYQAGDQTANMQFFSTLGSLLFATLFSNEDSWEVELKRNGATSDFTTSRQIVRRTLPRKRCSAALSSLLYFGAGSKYAIGNSAK